MRKYILIAVVGVILGFVVAAKAGNDGPPNPKLVSGYSYSEVTLRDYLAGQFMNGWVSNTGLRVLDPDVLAKKSYQYADAMLAERAK